LKYYRIFYPFTILYHRKYCAVPLNELRQIYDEVDNLIVSEDSLHATLGTNFSAYVTVYNDIVQEEAKIPPVEAPATLFLQRQLDAAQTEPGADHSPAHEADNFSEQVEDYVFEP